MYKSINPKTLLFAGRLFERFWKKHTVLGCTSSSTPGGTHHSEVGRPRYERRKIQERRWDHRVHFEQKTSGEDLYHAIAFRRPKLAKIHI